MEALDNPVWSSLSTSHSPFARGNADALRFDRKVSPFAAMPDREPVRLEALKGLISPGQVIMLLQRYECALSPSFEVKEIGLGVQMVADPSALSDAPDTFAPTALGEGDAKEMMALARLTRPGPFLPRTHELGTFWGIREQGRLVAMAGERLRQPGYRELSGVCTHPDFRGRGYGRLLSQFVTRQIVNRGETPYLHAYARNEPAVKLYETLGYRHRCDMWVAVLTCAD